MRHFFVAGFDFGTSYSKVVLRDQLTGLAKAVTFGPTASGLFPSFVRVGKGVLSGPESSGGELVLCYPKLIATDAAANTANFSSIYGDNLHEVHRLLGTQSLVQVASLALARYFLSVLDAIHRFLKTDDDWGRFDATNDPMVVQLAVPIGLNTADNACDRMMQRALAAATLLRLQSTSPASHSFLAELRNAFEQLEQMHGESRENLNARCITYPEVAAGVHTILRSPNTPDGKYITMDVGAGTVDLNTFLRRRSEVPTTRVGLDYWSCEVRPLGSSRLIFPHGSLRRQPHELSVNPLQESDLVNQLGDAIRVLMAGAFRYQPNRLRGSRHRPWMQNTFAFVWGGGAAHRIYEETMERALEAANVKINGVNRLPRPSEHFTLPHDVDFGRLAIAYGLSFHKANLETVRLPRELKTFDDLYPDYWQEVLEHDKLCTCRGNPACVRCYGSGLIKPDHSIAPRWDINLSQQAPLSPPQKSRIQRALEYCIERYHQFSRLPRPPFLVERFLLLERIRQLRSRPEIRDGLLVQQQADAILLYNVNRFVGRLRILKHSAKRNGNGCHCVVLRAGGGECADISLSTLQPHRLEMNVNSDSQQRHVDIICRINRTERREFELIVTKHKAPEV